MPPLQASEYQSHRWTVYLRSPSGEDLSHVLKKVTFVLHESFQNPKRDVEFPPYELTEVGWGEFDIIVTLHFRVGGCVRAWGGGWMWWEEPAAARAAASMLGCVHAAA